MGLDSQFMTVDGRCVCCGDMSKICNSASSFDIRGVPPLGVCDLCAYALGHAWRRELGQLVRATSPRVSRTYFLVPRLPAGKGSAIREPTTRSETDLASYQFVVAPDGNLPYVDFPLLSKQVAWLKDRLGVVTWEPLFRPCYLGYAASGDFSEVVLARAWGRISGARDKARSSTFGELLEKPTPDAGFYLGVKAAFEGLLWLLEQAQEGSTLCTVMRESAMRYLDAQLAGKRKDGDGDGDDPTMVEMFRTMMSADELEVVRIVVEAAKCPIVVAPAAAKKVVEDEHEKPADVEGSFDGTEKPAAGSSEDVPEGFARPARITP